MDCRGVICEVPKFILTIHVSVCCSVFVLLHAVLWFYVCVSVALRSRGQQPAALSDQVTKVGVFPLSSVACMSASPSLSPNSFCLSRFLLPLSAPLSCFLVTEALGLRHPSFFLWHHYRPLSLLSKFLPFPLFLSLPFFLLSPDSS